MTEPDPQPPPSQPPSSPPPHEPSPLAGLLRAFKIFLVPFLLSWALAYIGANRELEWLYFAGLGGVGVALLGLLVWLI
jgi:hypothetical protein